MKEENLKFKTQQENFEDLIKVLGETEEVLKRKVRKN
jgi:RNAse (barnase) inhibitor barstar